MRHHKGEAPHVLELLTFAFYSVQYYDGNCKYARKLAERVGKELGIPIYCYENAAFTPERRNLATLRAGQYEGLKEKLANPNWKPDFGPGEFNERVAGIGRYALVQGISWLPLM